ncbi:hypothetical protein, partial [Streptococcus suis]|uniref:hypothetical protein n=1 Tax=Streptococcus suis TaxID=1307 RepID=UPI003CF48FA9
DSFELTPAGRKVLVRGSSQLLLDIAACFLQTDTRLTEGKNTRGIMPRVSFQGWSPRRAASTASYR